MIRAGIIGAAGYTGGETLRLLLQHPSVDAESIVAVSESHAGRPVSDAHPDLAGWTSLTFASELTPDVDVVFLCSGHGKARTWMSSTHGSEAMRVIDLSMDHRIEGAYHDFVYGLPELQRERIRAARHIANPGCFATCITLALLPLAHAGHLHSAVVNAITGSTGAGQSLSDTSHFSWRDSNVAVYKAFEHQHEPEILQALRAEDGGRRALTFVPMRGPFTRGILASCVVEHDSTSGPLVDRYRAFYASHPFVHVGDDLPDLKRVVNTNMCHIGIVQHGSQTLVVSVIDNLLKGAAGQAVQNMNLIFDRPETEGLMLKSSVF
jgi:N-acetyl-gamma-glutamyl-phosphate reductase